jgi:hypothetical protein
MWRETPLPVCKLQLKLKTLCGWIRRRTLLCFACLFNEIKARSKEGGDVLSVNISQRVLEMLEARRGFQVVRVVVNGNDPAQAHMHLACLTPT